jgi:hypothetical protein
MTMTTPEGREIHTALEEAVFLRLGGAVAACHRLEVSTQAVYKLLATGYVSSRKLALELESATGVTAAELMNLAPWNPGGRPPAHPPEPKRKQGRRRDPKASRHLASAPNGQRTVATEGAPAQEIESCPTCGHGSTQITACSSRDFARKAA